MKFIYRLFIIKPIFFHKRPFWMLRNMKIWSPSKISTKLNWYVWSWWGKIWMPSFISSKKKIFLIALWLLLLTLVFLWCFISFFLDSYKQNHMSWVARTREYISCSPEKFKSKTSSELMPVQVCMSSKNDASVVVFMLQEASAHPLGSLLDRH